MAVNSRPQADANGTENSKSGASQSTREELLNRFQTLTDRKAGSSNGDPALQRGSISAPIQSGPPPVQQSGTDSELAALLLASNNTTSHAQPPYTTNAAVPMPHSPAAVVPGTSQYHHHGNSPTMPHAQQQSHPNATPRHSTAHEKEKPDDGPYKQEMVSRMEGLGKGERVLPPCDRCRRLHMDCLKNLTACMGCTKKHAKCSWREVREDELLGTAPAIRSGSTVGVGNQYHGLPMDPALQSPVYDQSYRPVMTTSAASMGSAPAYSYAHHASGGAEGGDHDSVEASLHQLAGFAEAEAAVTAAKRAQESREAIGDHHESITDPSRDQYEHIFRGGTNEEDRTRDADHAAYLEQLSNLHETHQSRVASHHENPQYPPMTDQQHEKSGDGSSNVRPRSRQDQNVEMTDMDKEHAELIQRRLARAQQDSPEGEASRNAAISPRTQDPALADRRSPYGYEDPQPRPGTAVSSGAGGSGAPEAAVREHIAAM